MAHCTRVVRGLAPLAPSAAPSNNSNTSSPLPALVCHPPSPLPYATSHHKTQSQNPAPCCPSPRAAKLNNNPKQAIAKLDALKAAKNGTSVEKVSIKMPDVDLTGHLPAGKDIVSGLGKPIEAVWGGEMEA